VERLRAELASLKSGPLLRLQKPQPAQPRRFEVEDDDG